VADPASEVRSLALEGLEKIVAIIGPDTLQELEVLEDKPEMDVWCSRQSTLSTNG